MCYQMREPIYMYCEKARLIYWSTVVGAALKSKGDHTTIYTLHFSQFEAIGQA